MENSIKNLRRLSQVEVTPYLIGKSQEDANEYIAYIDDSAAKVFLVYPKSVEIYDYSPVKNVPKAKMGKSPYVRCPYTLIETVKDINEARAFVGNL